MKTTKPKSPTESGSTAVLEPSDEPSDEPALPPEATPAETPLAETLPAIPPPPLPPAITAPPAAAPVAPEHRYFKKIQVAMPLRLDNARIPFEVLDQNIGVIKLNPATDGRTIEFLVELCRVRKGGVTEIDEETFKNLKKNHPFLKSVPRSQQPKLRVWDSRPKQSSPSASAVGVAAGSNLTAPGSSRGSAGPVFGGEAGAGKAPASFTANLQRKSGVLKLPASGQFRADAGIPPALPA